MNLTRADRVLWWLYQRANAKAKEAYYRRLAWLGQLPACLECGGNNPDPQNHDVCADCRGAA